MLEGNRPAAYGMVEASRLQGAFTTDEMLLTATYWCCVTGFSTIWETQPCIESSCIVSGHVCLFRCIMHGTQLPMVYGNIDTATTYASGSAWFAAMDRILLSGLILSCQQDLC